jgi:hypothetical protein
VKLNGLVVVVIGGGGETQLIGCARGCWQVHKRHCRQMSRSKCSAGSADQDREFL